MNASHWRTSVVMTFSVVLGFLAFGLAVPARARCPARQLGHGNDAGVVFTVLMGLMAMLVLAELSSGGLDAKTVAVLGVLAAAGAALRVLSAGTAGLEPMFFLLIVAGRVLGARHGFLLGALALLASAFITAGVGPWTPFQMLACGWVTLGAGLLPPARGRAEQAMLALPTRLVTGLAYGALMNLWFWPFMGDAAPAGASYVPGAGAAVNLGHYLVFYLTTSLAWDLPRGILSATLILLASGPLLAALRRAVRRAHFDAPVTFVPTGESP